MSQMTSNVSQYHFCSHEQKIIIFLSRFLVAGHRSHSGLTRTLAGELITNQRNCGQLVSTIRRNRFASQLPSRKLLLVKRIARGTWVIVRRIVRLKRWTRVAIRSGNNSRGVDYIKASAFTGDEAVHFAGAIAPQPHAKRRNAPKHRYRYYRRTLEGKKTGLAYLPRRAFPEGTRGRTDITRGLWNFAYWETTSGIPPTMTNGLAIFALRGRASDRFADRHRRRCREHLAVHRWERKHVSVRQYLPPTCLNRMKNRPKYLFQIFTPDVLNS